MDARVEPGHDESGGGDASVRPWEERAVASRAWTEPRNLKQPAICRRNRS